MNDLYKKLLLIFPSLCFLQFASAQANEIKIRFIANSGFSMSDGHSTIYIDFPYKSGFYNYSEYDPSEVENIRDSSVLIFTHRHPDHYSGKLVRKLEKKKAVKAYGPWNVDQLSKLGSFIHDFSIQAYQTKHRLSSHHCSYLVTWHGRRIFISGDTEHAETIATLNDMDWAFVPVWLLLDANDKNIKIKAKMVGLYHIGTKDHITVDNPKIKLLDQAGYVITVTY